MRDLVPARNMLTEGQSTDDQPNSYFSKDERLNTLVIDGLRDFLGMFRRPAREGKNTVSGEPMRTRMHMIQS